MQKFLSNLNKNYLFVLLIITYVFLLKPVQVFADLPTGNAVKDPNAILRNALPTKQPELQDIQHKLENTSDLVRGGRWPALSKSVTKCQSLVKKSKEKIISELNSEQRIIAEEIYSGLSKDLKDLSEEAKLKNKYSFINLRKNLGNIFFIFKAK